MEGVERIEDQGREASQNLGRIQSPGEGKGEVQRQLEDLKVVQSQEVLVMIRERGKAEVVVGLEVIAKKKNYQVVVGDQLISLKIFNQQKISL